MIELIVVYYLMLPFMGFTLYWYQKRIDNSRRRLEQLLQLINEFALADDPD